jgi:murein DD-endopeptidase MepM/ murein hydrolase activator NlpD
MTRPSIPSSSLPAVDLRAETAAASTPPAERAQLATLAAEFESMLMLEMIKQMRRSLLDEDSEGEGLGADTFSSTIDTELSRHLAQGGGLGLQTELLRAWDRQAGTDVAALDRPGATSGIIASAVAVAAPASVIRPAPAALPGLDVDPEPALSLDMDARVSSRFGWRRDPFAGQSRFHGGIDLAASYGTDVPAAADGTVVTAGEQGGYGLTVVVRHPGGYQTRYAHLSSLDVQVGDAIQKGSVLGRVGSTGRSTAPHLHFEVTQGGQRVDPDRFVRNLTGDIKGQ